MLWQQFGGSISFCKYCRCAKDIFLQKSKKRLFIFISISLEIVENQTDCKARKRYRLKICEIL